MESLTVENGSLHFVKRHTLIAGSIHVINGLVDCTCGPLFPFGIRDGGVVAFEKVRFNIEFTSKPSLLLSKLENACDVMSTCWFNSGRPSDLLFLNCTFLITSSGRVIDRVFFELMSNDKILKPFKGRAIKESGHPEYGDELEKHT